MAKTTETRVTEMWRYEPGTTKLELPLYSVGVSAGFPSPADDSLEKNLSLDELLIKHSAATYFVRVQGDSMVRAVIHSGDILVVDRAIEPRSGNVVIALIDGEFVVKRFNRSEGKCYLLAENPAFKPIEVTESMNMEVRGVVTYVIHKV